MPETYRIEIPDDILTRSFERALSYPEHSRATFFSDLRRAFKGELEEVFLRQGVVVDRYGTLASMKWQAGTVVEKEPIISKYNERLGIEFCFSVIRIKAKGTRSLAKIGLRQATIEG